MEVAFFWVFQQKFRLVDQFRKEIVNSFKYEFLTTFWLQKSFFCIYLDPSSARNLWNFEWGTRILKNLGIIDHSTINFHNHKRNGKTMIYKIEFERRTAIPTLQNTFAFRTKWLLGGWWWGEEIELKPGRNRVYLKAAADDKCNMK